MTARAWLPTRFQDELIPPLRDMPDAWVILSPDGYVIDDPFGEVTIRLRDGDIVEFDWREHYGSGDVTFASGGGWTCSRAEPVPSDGASELMVAAMGYYDSMAVGLRNFCTQWLDNAFPTADPITVEFYAWSRVPTRFEFRDGRFVATSMAS